MNNPFTTPAPAGSSEDRINMDELIGSLVIIDPLEVKYGFETSSGSADPVRAKVAVVDGALAGRNYDDALLFGKVLKTQLESKIGQKVLGRIGKGNAQPGKSAPWIINPATDADVQLGMAHLAQAMQPAPVQQQVPQASTFPAASSGGAPPF